MKSIRSVCAPGIVSTAALILGIVILGASSASSAYATESVPEQARISVVPLEHPVSLASAVTAVGSTASSIVGYCSGQSFAIGIGNPANIGLSQAGDRHIHIMEQILAYGRLVVVSVQAR